VSESIKFHDLAWTSEFFEQLLAISDDAVIAAEPASGIVLFNRGAERIFGYQPDEILGSPLETLLPERFRASHPAKVKAFASGDEEARLMGRRSEIFGLRKNGEEFPAEASIAHFEHDGRLIYTAILRDLTRREATERNLRRTVQEKDVLLREIHHRVKNNLQVISSLLSLQARSMKEPLVRRALEDSRGRVQSMALIHEQLYNSGNLAQVDFAGYLRELSTGLFRSFAADPAQIDLRMELADVTIAIDKAVPCGLIVNELLSNALKYAFPDGRSGWLRLSSSVMPDGTLVLSISDDGPGIPPEVGLWNTPTLGLRLVRMLVRQLDGEVSLNGPPGAEFRVRFAIDSLGTEDS